MTMFTWRKLARLVFASVASASIAPSAMAQQAARPSQITLVVPFAAGGATDIVSRLVAQKFTQQTGVSVVVENVGGAGGVPGAQRVMRGKPDGSVLLMGTVSTHAINPLMAAKPPYDPEKDFTPISLLAVVPNVLIVNPKLAVKDVKELVAFLKAEPDRHSYATSGNGTPPHLSGELFKSLAGVKMSHLPYRGGGPAMNDLVAGHVQIMFDVLSGAAEFIRSGSARGIAVTTKERVPAFPGIPTVAEAGLPGYETYTWNAIFGPPGVPAAIVAKLNAELRRVVADTDIKKRLADLSAVTVGSSAEELAAQIKVELAKWRPVIEAAGLKQAQ
jgi:tripartite-type tricarboxylate transporter receptor subunit TctC